MKTNITCLRLNFTEFSVINTTSQYKYQWKYTCCWKDNFENDNISLFLFQHDHSFLTFWLMLQRLVYLSFLRTYQIWMSRNFLFFFSSFWDKVSLCSPRLIFFFSTRAWSQGLHLEPFHQPFFVMGVFKIGSRELFACAGFEPAAILLISASWVARITGVSRQHPALRPVLISTTAAFLCLQLKTFFQTPTQNLSQVHLNEVDNLPRVTKDIAKISQWSTVNRGCNC
jgi:hypothetical protein